MAKGLREINSRIKSVKSTAQITRAMQLVASSKMRRAQESAIAGRPYEFLLADILDCALDNLGGEYTHPLVCEREVKTRGILLVTTDKGLCGALNANLYRLINEIPSDAAKFVAIGRKGAQHIARTGRTLLAEFSISDRVNFSEVRAPGEYLIKQFLDGTVDTVEIVYPHFKNTLVQVPLILPLLPIGDLDKVMDAALKKLGQATLPEREDQREMVFEPDAREILAQLPAMYFKHTLYHAVLEAKASEQSARMVAMKAATDNAQKITESLTLEYNKARQAAITNEINEISAATLSR